MSPRAPGGLLISWCANFGRVDCRLLCGQSGTNMWNNLRRFRDARTVRGIAVVRFDAQLFFANTAAFQVRIPARSNHVVVSHPCMYACVCVARRNW